MNKVFLKLIRLYQAGISPLFGDCCRFYPSCSEYCYLAIKKHGTAKGLLKGVKRVLKCHPLNKGGIDLP